MTLKDMLNRRRSVRHFDTEKPLNDEKVRECLRLAQLAPSSSNMQLYEFYHVTDKAVLKQLAVACLGQKAATTALQMVVFVTRQDLHRARAKAVLAFERGNIQRNSPVEKQANRLKMREMYYGKLMPLMYARGCGMVGAVRTVLFSAASLFRPMITLSSECDSRVVVQKSCGLAAQTFMLAMSEADYDTCPMEGFDERRVKRILKLPRGSEVNMIIACGVRKEGRGLWGERFRVPFADVYRQI